MICGSSNYHRWYRPSDGRYLSPDPLGLAGGDSGYFAYVGGNPLGAIDPDGRMQSARVRYCSGGAGNGVGSGSVLDFDEEEGVKVTCYHSEIDIEATPSTRPPTRAPTTRQRGLHSEDCREMRSEQPPPSLRELRAAGCSVPPFNQYWYERCMACCQAGTGTANCKANCRRVAENGGDNGQNMPRGRTGQCWEQAHPGDGPTSSLDGP